MRACGGISAQDLARRVGITSQLMLYHLQLLEKAGLLVHDAGKRARGKGGKFRARVQRIDLSVRRDAPTDRRRINAILSAFEAETQDACAPDSEGSSAMRSERLSNQDARRIARALAEIDSILAEASARRESDVSLPEATHVITANLRRAVKPPMPSPAWSCRTVRGGRDSRR